METEKTLALVLRQADFSESSRVVTWLTPRLGKLATVAKGAKRLKGPFESALDLLAICEVVILRKSTGGLDILTEAKLRQRFTPYPGQLASLYGGYYIAELLDAMCESDDSNPVLFEMTVTALERLSTDPEVVLTLSWFELNLLRELGQLPQFEACVVCGAPLTEAAQYGFLLSAGGMVCPTCHEPGESRRMISAATLAVVGQLATENDTTWQRLVLTVRQTRELRSLLTPLIIQLLGRQPKTLRYLPL